MISVCKSSEKINGGWNRLLQFAKELCTAKSGFGVVNSF